MPCATENFDTDTMHSTVTNSSRVTIKTAGKYIILGQSSWSLDNNGRRETRLYLNGSTLLTTSTSSPVDGGHCEYALVKGASLSVNDYVELKAFQNSGSVLTISVGLEVVQVAG